MQFTIAADAIGSYVYPGTVPEFKDLSQAHCAAIKTAIELVCSGMKDHLLVPLEREPFRFHFVAVTLDTTTKTVNVAGLDVIFYSSVIYRCQSSVVRIPGCVLSEFQLFAFQSIQVSAADEKSLLWDVMDAAIHSTFDAIAQNFTPTGMAITVPGTQLSASAAERIEVALSVMCSDAAPCAMLIPLNKERADWTAPVPYVYLVCHFDARHFDDVRGVYVNYEKSVTADLVTLGRAQNLSYIMSRNTAIVFNHREVYRAFPGFDFNLDSARFTHPRVFFNPVSAHYTDLIRELGEKLRVDKLTALAMAFHGRLGAAALIAGIGGDNLELVVKWL